MPQPNDDRVMGQEYEILAEMEELADLERDCSVLDDLHHELEKHMRQARSDPGWSYSGKLWLPSIKGERL